MFSSHHDGFLSRFLNRFVIGKASWIRGLEVNVEALPGQSAAPGVATGCWENTPGPQLCFSEPVARCLLVGPHTKALYLPHQHPVPEQCTTIRNGLIKEGLALEGLFTRACILAGFGGIPHGWCVQFHHSE